MMRSLKTADCTHACCSCGFGHTCKFHHPEVLEGDVAVAAVVGAAPGSPPTPFAAVQYLPFSGAYTMAYTYPGGGCWLV